MKIEDVDEKQVKALMRSLTPVQCAVLDLSRVDIRRGRGVLGMSEHCLWTHRGHRITVTVASDGGIIASASKKVDDEMPWLCGCNERIDKDVEKCPHCGHEVEEAIE